MNWLKLTCAALSVMSMTISLTAMTGHIFDIMGLYQWTSGYVGMAFNTSIALFAVSTATFMLSFNNVSYWK